MSYELRSARWIAADVLRQVVQPGDTVVDATLGNGHDTLMLCELVGETGRVIGFDIQPDAVERTRERLADAGMLSRCTLYAEGHEHLSERVTVPIRTATFNLGWLPGGDKRITTHWETTRAAISAALSLLMKGGVCTICAYPGARRGRRGTRRADGVSVGAAPAGVQRAAPPVFERRGGRAGVLCGAEAVKGNPRALPLNLPEALPLDSTRDFVP